MNDRKVNPIRETDETARALARGLVDEALFGALAALEPETGVPVVSRIAVGTDENGQLISLASDLSGHSKAIDQDQRCSILLGEPGKGDPLAHPRITLVGKLNKIARDSAEIATLRETWLARHPKAALYIDFGDFNFYRLELERAFLNGGFGKAYVLQPSDLGAQS